MVPVVHTWLFVCMMQSITHFLFYYRTCSLTLTITLMKLNTVWLWKQRHQQQEVRPAFPVSLNQPSSVCVLCKFTTIFCALADTDVLCQQRRLSLMVRRVSSGVKTHLVQGHSSSYVEVSGAFRSLWPNLKKQQSSCPAYFWVCLESPAHQTLRSPGELSDSKHTHTLRCTNSHSRYKSMCSSLWLWYRENYPLSLCSLD